MEIQKGQLNYHTSNVTFLSAQLWSVVTACYQIGLAILLPCRRGPAKHPPSVPLMIFNGPSTGGQRALLRLHSWCKLLYIHACTDQVPLLSVLLWCLAKRSQNFERPGVTIRDRDFTLFINYTDCF